MTHSNPPESRPRPNAGPKQKFPVTERPVHMSSKERAECGPFKGGHKAAPRKRK